MKSVSQPLNPLKTITSYNQYPFYTEKYVFHEEPASIYIGGCTPSAFGFVIELVSVHKKIRRKPLVHTILKPNL